MTPARIEATIRRHARRLYVRIVGFDAAGAVVGAVSSTFARSPQAQREAVAWCRRKGVTHYQITH